MRNDSLVSEIMNYIVSGYVYFVALMLVLFMMSSLVTGVLELVTGLLNISSSPMEILAAPERAVFELGLLHTIAFTIVLVKAYKILIAFAETRHINIKYLVEFAIIAPTIELVFNTKNYPPETLILFAAFAFCNLVAYLFFYKTIKSVSTDYEKERCVTK